MNELEPIGETALASSAVNSLEQFLEESDRPIVARYVALWEEWRDLVQHRDEHGRFQYDDKGNATPHPVVAMISDIEKRMLAIEKEVGLTPAARLKILGDSLNNEGKKQSLGDMLDGIEE